MIINTTFNPTIKLINGKLTKQSFKEIVKHFEKLDKQSRYLFISTKQAERIKYWSESIIIAEYLGYYKWQGPDGKSWFEKKYDTYKHFYGSGNKTRRRLGYDYDDLSGEWYK